MEQKNHFNDPRPLRGYDTSCPDCRASCVIKVKHYPHGLQKVTHCPVCGSELERHSIVTYTEV